MRLNSRDFYEASDLGSYRFRLVLTKLTRVQSSSGLTTKPLRPLSSDEGLAEARGEAGGAAALRGNTTKGSSTPMSARVLFNI